MTEQDLNQNGLVLESGSLLPILDSLLSSRGGNICPGNNLLRAIAQEHSHCMHSLKSISTRSSVDMSVAEY